MEFTDNEQGYYPQETLFILPINGTDEVPYHKYLHQDIKYRGIPNVGISLDNTNSCPGVD